MERQRVLVCGKDELREYLAPGMAPGRRIRMEGAGALCASGGHLFCACDWGSTIWRLDAALLVPTALFAGGPGICQMLLSHGGARLYALCADADSVLMLDALTGAPLYVNRVGVNPHAMTLNETGDMLAVAGGESGEALLLCAHTLRVLRRVSMPGMVYGVTFCEGKVHALCLNESLSSTLVTVEPGGARQTLHLPGMPGMLTMEREEGTLVAATQGYLHKVSACGSRILASCEAAGRAVRMVRCGCTLLLLDQLGEAVYALGLISGRWRLICEGARDMVRMDA